MKNRLIYIVISFIIIGGLLWYFTRSSTESVSESTVSFFGTTEVSPDSTTTPTTNTSKKLALTDTYKNTTYHFTLNIPEDAKPSEFDDASDGNNGHTVLIQDKTAQMQILITPFDEDIVLTKERIEQDVPDIGMQNPTGVSVDGTTGVAFTTSDGGKNNTQQYRQVWFVHKGNLYQTLSPIDQDSSIGRIMQTWKWQ